MGRGSQSQTNLRRALKKKQPGGRGGLRGRFAGDSGWGTERRDGTGGRRWVVVEGVTGMGGWRRGGEAGPGAGSGGVGGEGGGTLKTSQRERMGADKGLLFGPDGWGLLQTVGKSPPIKKNHGEGKAQMKRAPWRIFGLWPLVCLLTKRVWRVAFYFEHFFEGSGVLLVRHGFGMGLGREVGCGHWVYSGGGGLRPRAVGEGQGSGALRLGKHNILGLIRERVLPLPPGPERKGRAMTITGIGARTRLPERRRGNGGNEDN